MFNRLPWKTLLVIAGMLLITGSQSQAADANTQLEPMPSHSPESKKPTILWGKPGLAPLYIASGPMQHEGMGDNVMKMLQSHLTEYEHTNIQVNYPRMFVEMKKGKSFCSLLHLSEERSRFVYFSKPIAIIPGYQAYVSNKGKHRLEQVLGHDIKQVSLNTLLQNSTGLTLAITRKQSYGAQRDSLIDRHASKLDIDENFADQSSLTKMLAADRIQMVLAFPWVFNYQIKILKLHNRTHKIQLTDVPGYQSVSVACAMTPAGKAIVDAIDAITPAAITLTGPLVSEWLTPDEKSRYQEAYQNYLLTAGELN